MKERKAGKGGRGVAKRRTESGMKRTGKHHKKVNANSSSSFRKARQSANVPPVESSPPEPKRSGIDKKVTKKFVKRSGPIAEIKFSTKDRCTFLNGFSTRKLERKSNGHLKNKKKQILEKQHEKRQYANHIQKEYEKAHTSAIANMNKGNESLMKVEEDVLPTLEDETRFFTREDCSSIIDDGFGDVVVQISALESPEFAKIYKHEQPEEQSPM
jgi:hypothetical protein